MNFDDGFGGGDIIEGNLVPVSSNNIHIFKFCGSIPKIIAGWVVFGTEIFTMFRDEVESERNYKQ